jgi:hypothetical protein
MANELIGDFDVAAELSLPAVNRFFAAMHQAARFLHSVSARVDDSPPPGPRVPKPVLVGCVDSFGDPVVNHKRIGNPIVFPGPLAATNPIYSALDGCSQDKLSALERRPIAIHNPVANFQEVL